MFIAQHEELITYGLTSQNVVQQETVMIELLIGLMSRNTVMIMFVSNVHNYTYTRMSLDKNLYIYQSYTLYQVPKV